MREHAVAVFVGKSRGVQRDSEVFADPARVLQVGGRGAVAVFVLVPVAHEQRVHVVSGLSQQDRCDGRIDAAGQGKYDARGGHRRILPPTGTVRGSRRA
jgi:hypothetical protein